MAEVDNVCDKEGSGLMKENDNVDRHRTMNKDNLEELSHAAYWNARYSRNDQEATVYDWLRSTNSIKACLLNHLPPAGTDPLILHLGCGNSTMPADLLSLGFERQTAVDFSEIVIANMRSRNVGIRMQIMDVRSMDFPAGSFDICIDKTTLDSMLHGSLWDPVPEVIANVKAYIDEVLRVLKPDGTFLYITWRQPHFIRPLLQRDQAWSIEVESLSEGGGMLEYFAFVMRKSEPDQHLVDMAGRET